jgi:hypothetical protein
MGNQMINEWEDEAQYHWCPRSQPYAPGHILVHYLQTGWVVDEILAVEKIFFGAGRFVELYSFVLRRDADYSYMRVLGNPIVWRIVAEIEPSYLVVHTA